MIIIVEGIDRVGKTTLCKALEKVGFLYLKDFWHVATMLSSEKIPSYSVGKLDTTIGMLKMLNAQGLNIVVDRFHLTEWVYGTYTREIMVEDKILRKIDRILAEMDCTLVHVRPDDLHMSNMQAGVNLTEHLMAFEDKFSESEITRKYVTSYKHLNATVLNLINSAFKYDLYFASPFFNPAQIEREEALKDILRKQGLRIFSPKDEVFIPPEATLEQRDMAFKANCHAIKNSVAVFAITDEKDMGTIWEAGYAYGVNRPVIYYAETLGDNMFNLMLAQSGKKVLTHREGITKELILEAIFNEVEVFRGLIE